MSLEDLSGKKLALIAIGAIILTVFAISGFQVKNLFAPSVTEEAVVTIKEGSNCTVEGTDRIPRTISNCEYDVGDIILITYKPQQPSVERHELKARATGNG